MSSESISKRSLLFSDLARTARDNSVVLPRDIILLGKSMATIAGITRDLDPDFSLAGRFKPHTEKLIAERLEPANMLGRGATGLWRLLRLLNKLPGEVGQILRKLRTGSLEIVFKHEGLERPVAELDKASNRLAMSIVLASAVVASSLMMSSKLGILIHNVDLAIILGLLGYSVAAVLGAWLVVAVLRSGRM